MTKYICAFLLLFINRCGLDHSEYSDDDTHTESSSKFSVTTDAGGIPVLYEKHGTNDGEFISPRDIAFDSQGNVYITDNDNNRVKKFTANGAFITKWNCKDPHGIAVDKDGCVYVADAGGNLIHKFQSEDGITYFEIGSWPVNTPLGVALDLSGNIYVCEAGDNLVRKYSADTSYITSLDGGFNTPVYLQLDSTGNVYVADHYNHSIKKFTSTDGINYSYEVLCSVNYPQGITVDALGYVYVTEYNDNCVKKFDPNGRLVESWGQSDLDYGQFTNPIGVEVSLSGRVYVADHGAHRIKVFTPIYEPPDTAPEVDTVNP